MDESGEALRENGEESGSEGNQNDTEEESSPMEVKKPLAEPTSPDSARISTEVSEDVPLVNN